MTRSNLYSILCTLVRLGAVYIFVTTAVGFVGILFTMRLSRADAFDWLSVGESALGLVLALLLWMFPGPFARIAANRRSLERFESDIEPYVLQYIAVSTLGLWFAIYGLSQLAFTLHRWVFVNAYLLHQMPDPRNDPKVYGPLSMEIAQVVLGIGVALGSRGIVALLTRLRYGGLGPAQAEDAPGKPQEEA
jgi:hypothetical protein